MGQKTYTDQDWDNYFEPSSPVIFTFKSEEQEKTPLNFTKDESTSTNQPELIHKETITHNDEKVEKSSKCCRCIIS